MVQLVNRSAPNTTLAEQILELFWQSGALENHGHTICQLTHALQAAELAENEGADDELILATLLHDLGNLLSPTDLGATGLAGWLHHERRAARFLHGKCAPRIVWLVAHHTAAKRYLCSVYPQYEYQLSVASQRSLGQQGGPMTASERMTFAAHPWAMDAVRLRRWDDRANVPTWTPVPLDHFADRLREHFGRCWSLTCRTSESSESPTAD
jgi:[1-hydroxy-2-(trimethylamino)ethyl]phosphonate dioxygenase